MDPTTVLTDTQSVVLLNLSSGNTAMVVYSITVGETVIILLLAVIVALDVVQIWRGRRC